MQLPTANGARKYLTAGERDAFFRAADLDGPHASPKGLRHGFGVAAVSAGIPLNLVQKWLGHAQLTTTAIYANAVGAEEQDIARRMWG
jgi:integrase/recombinase XerD